jgi:proteasome lid subunit RPN8/RPN11
MKTPKTPANSIKLARAACLSILASVAEVYPKECVGVAYRRKGMKTICAAFPIQIANRRKASVDCTSPVIFDTFAECGEYERVCDYHSHPYEANYNVGAVQPSKTDIEGLEVGEVEIIVNVQKKRSKKEEWIVKDGSIHVIHKNYVYEISAFMRIQGSTSRGPLYKRVYMRLGK